MGQNGEVRDLQTQGMSLKLAQRTIVMRVGRRGSGILCLIVLHAKDGGVPECGLQFAGDLRGQGEPRRRVGRQRQHDCHGESCEKQRPSGSHPSENRAS